MDINEAIVTALTGHVQDDCVLTVEEFEQVVPQINTSLNSTRVAAINEFLHQFVPQRHFIFGEGLVEKLKRFSKLDQAALDKIDARSSRADETFTCSPPEPERAKVDYSYVIDRHTSLPHYAEACVDAQKYEDITIENSSGTAKLRIFGTPGDNPIMTVYRRLRDSVNGRSFVAESLIAPQPNYEYMQGCHLNDDGVPDVLMKLEADDDYITITSNVNTNRPLGAGVMNNTGGQDQSVAVFPHTPDPSCEFVYTMDYLETLTPKMAEVYREADQSMTDDEFHDFLSRKLPGGKDVELGGNNRSDSHVSLTLNQDPPGYGYKYNKIGYRFGYNFTHGKAVYINDDDLPDFIIDTVEGGYMVFLSQKTGSDANPSELCLVDQSAPFPPAWQSGLEGDESYSELVSSSGEEGETAKEVIIELPPGVLPGADNNTFAIENQVFFDVDKSTVSRGGMSSLESVYALIESIQSQTGNPVVVEVHGHTDHTGSEEYNYKLSEDRVHSVKGKLISLGIDSEHIITVPHGETEPVATNLTEAGRAANRRVEFKLVSTSTHDGKESTQVYTVVVSGRDQEQMEYKTKFEDENWTIRGGFLDESYPFSIEGN